MVNDWLIHRRKFRRQTSDNMDRWNAEQGRGREKRKIRREKIRRERVRRKKIQMREKVGKSRNTVFFQWFVAPEGRKVGSLKRRVRSQMARWVMKNCTPLWREKHILKSKRAKHLSSGPLLEVAMSKKCTPLWREAHFEVKMYKHTILGPLLEVEMLTKCTPLWREAHFQVKSKTHQVRTIFGSWDVEKVHAVVARSTFPSQNVQRTPFSDHFWKLRCRKSARRYGAKHISKSKCTKHHMFAPLLEVWMLEKCTPLWREAHFQIKMFKTLGVRTTFWGSDVASLRFTTLHYTTLHSTTLLYITLNYATFHYTSLHYTTLHSTTLQLHNYTTTLHYTPLHSTTLNYTTLNYTTLHYTLHYTTLHSWHSTTLHYNTLHYTTLHYTQWHCTTDRQVDS